MFRLSKNPLSGNRIHYLTFALLLLSGFFQGLGALQLNANLQAGDQGAYLQLSLAQSEVRKLTDGNRHPLYPLLLAPLATREPSSFAQARWLSLFLGMVLLFSLGWNEFRRNNPIAGILAVGWLASQVQMVRTLSEIWCEPLLYLLVFWLWARLDSKGEKTGLPEKKTPAAHLTNGILTGMIYLTKGTGLQIAVLFWATVLFVSKKRAPVLLGVLSFVVVASPLLIWNWKTYGNPLYSFASTHNMWFDEPDEIWYDDPEDLPTLSSYLAGHTASEITVRLVRGLWLESKMAFQLLVLDWRLPEGSGPLARTVLMGFKILFGAFLLAGAAVWIRNRSKESICSTAAFTFFLLSLAVFFISFGWYAQLTNAPRFLMTLAPIGVVLLSRLASMGAGSINFSAGGDRRSMEEEVSKETTSFIPLLRLLYRGPFSVFSLLLFFYSIFLLSQSAAFAWKTMNLPPPQVSPSVATVLQEIDKLPPHARIAFGPSHSLPLWMTPGDIHWRPIPWRIDWHRFEKFLEREEIGYVMIDSETLARRPYLAPLAAPTATETYGWPIVFRERGVSDFFILYKVEQYPSSGRSGEGL